MRAIKAVELRNNQKKFFDAVSDEGEILIISRPTNKNVVILSEEDFNKREKALRNAEYLLMLDKSLKEAESGEVVKYSMEQLKSLVDSE